MARATRDEWAKRVQRWRASGLTARAFAAREGFNANTLKWWATSLREATRTGAFIDVTPLVAKATSPAIEVVVRDSIRVRVTKGFEPELLRAVVAALEAR